MKNYMDDEEMIARLLLDGHCCTKAIVKMGLHVCGDRMDTKPNAAPHLSQRSMKNAARF